MRSKKTLRERQCGKKIPYRTWEEAERVADLLNTQEYIRNLRITAQKIKPYRCTFCSHIHIGHTPRKILVKRGINVPDKHNSVA